MRQSYLIIFCFFGDCNPKELFGTRILGYPTLVSWSSTLFNWYNICVYWKRCVAKWEPFSWIVWYIITTGVPGAAFLHLRPFVLFLFSTHNIFLLLWIWLSSHDIHCITAFRTIFWCRDGCNNVHCNGGLSVLRTLLSWVMRGRGSSSLNKQINKLLER